MSENVAPGRWFKRAFAALNSGDFERDFRARIVFGCSAIFSASLVILAVQDFVYDRYLAGTVIAFCPFVLILGQWLLLRHRNLDMAAIILIITSLFTAIMLMAATGGRAIGVYVFLPIIVLIATVGANRTAGYFAGTFCLLLPFLGAWLESQPWIYPIHFDAERMVAAAVRTSFVASFACIGCMHMYSRAMKITRQQIIEAQELALLSREREAAASLASDIADRVDEPIRTATGNVMKLQDGYSRARAALKEITDAVMQADGEGTAELRRAVDRAVENAGLDAVDLQLRRVLQTSTDSLDEIRELLSPQHPDESANEEQPAGSRTASGGR